MSDAYVPCEACKQECSLHVGIWVEGKPYHPWCLAKVDIKPVQTTLRSSYKKLLDEHMKMRIALGKIALHGEMHTETPPHKNWNVFDTWYNRGFDKARNIATHALKEIENE